MRNINTVIFFVLIGGCFFTACSNKKEEIQTPPLSDYFPLKTGKYITYRLDSIVLTQFGSDTTVHSYVVKDVVDAAITDTLGQKGFRIFRHITDSAQRSGFVPNNTFMAVNLNGNQIQYLDNNLRFIKLRFPVMEGFQWQGNSYIDAASSNSTLSYMLGWKYTYQNIGKPFTIRGKTYNNTITVLQKEEEESPPGPFVTSQYKQWNYSVEVYAKDIGLIYKHFNHKTWQLDPSPAHWEDGSYRLILEIIGNN